MLKNPLEKVKVLDQIFSLLTQAKVRDPAFDFRVAKKNSTGKSIGTCWQDGVMRVNC